MGGRGATGTRGARGGGIGGGGGGGAFTVRRNPNGGVTITPKAQNVAQASTPGSRISDTNSHTTYFTPADKAIVSNDVTDGFAVARSTGMHVPVGYYQTSYYSNINGELRDLAGGKRSRLSPKTQKVVDAMDRNMQPLNNPIDTVRWTSLDALADNIGMKGANGNSIINRLKNQDAIKIKDDYTSSSWKASANAVAGTAGRNVRIDLHYAKGAKVQFSPTRKEGEMVGARGTPQRFSNARYERVTVQNARYGNRTATVLVVDCYVDQ